MKLRIYQIDLSLDEHHVAFRSHAEIQNRYGGRVPAELYRKAYEGTVEAENPFVVNPDADGNHSFLLSREYPHHFTGPVVTTKSWMKKYFPQEDRRFLQMDFWGAKRIADLLRKVPERNQTQAMLHFHRLKYSEYDLDQPFLEQFQRNQDKLIAILTRMANENN